MPETVIYALCLAGCALPFGAGIGVTLWALKRLPRGAYFLGFFIPVLVPILLWVLYTTLAPVPPCAPAQAACGERDAYAFFLLGGLLLFNLGVSAMVQFVLYRIELRKNPPPNEDWRKRDL